MGAGSFAQVGFEAQIRGTSQYVANVGKIAVANKQLLSNIGRTSRNIGRTLTLGLTLPIVAGSALSFKMASDFDFAFTKINTLVGISADKVEGFKDAVLELSGETARSPQELAEALFVVTSAGARGAQALETLEFAAKAAASGLGETRDIARAVTAIVTAFGEENISAAKATDVLLATVRAGNLEASELASTLGKALPLVAAAGLEFEDAGAFIATFTRLGVDSAQAVTALKATMQTLIKTTPVATKALDSVGLSISGLREIAGEEGLAKTLLFLVDAFDGDIEKIAEVIPNVEALAGVLGTAVGQEEAFIQVDKEIRDSLGLTAEAFETTAETPAFKLQKALNDLKIVMIEIGAVVIPIVVKGITAFSGVIDRLRAGIEIFNNLPKPVQTAILAFVGLLAVLGPAIFLFGVLASSLSAIIAIAPLVGVAVTVMLGPWGLLLLAIVAVIAAGVVIHKNWDEITDAAEALGRAFEQLGKAIGGGLHEAFQDVVGFGKATLDVLFFIPKKVFKFGKAIPVQMAKGFSRGVDSFIRDIENFVIGIINRLNPFNWVFGSNMVDVFREIGEKSSEAMIDSLAERLRPFGAILEASVVEPLRLVRDFVGGLQSELSRLLNLPSVESVIEDLALAGLRLREFGLEAGAEEDLEARTQKIENLRKQIERLTEAQAKERKELEDKRDAIKDEIDALSDRVPFEDPQVIAARRKELEGEIDSIDDQIEAIQDGTDSISKQIDAIEAQIDITEEARTARERELKSIQNQIENLTQLADKRRLERDILLARGQAADQTLATDNQIIVAANTMIAAIAGTTAEFAGSAGVIQTVYIPALFDAQQAMLATGESAGSDGLAGTMADLEDFMNQFDLDSFGDELEDGEFDMDEFKENARENLGIEVPGFFDKLGESLMFYVDTSKAGFEKALQFAVDWGQGTIEAIQLVLGATGLGGLATAARTKMFNFGKVVAGGIIDGLDFIAKSAGPISLANSIGNAIIGVINKLITKINRALEFKIEVPLAPDIKINPPNIPPIPLFGRGGDIAAGQLGIVGDKGAELFVPSSAGEIVPLGSGGDNGIARLLAGIAGMSSSSLKNYGNIQVTAADEEGAMLLRQLVRSMS